MPNILNNYYVYVAESFVILSILVFVGYILYSLGLFNIKK